MTMKMNVSNRQPISKEKKQYHVEFSGQKRLGKVPNLN